jgi:hypothetical protein
MFSYTQIAKEIVDGDIYNLGTRLYLDGGIGVKEQLLIDNWRIYNIKDATKSYRVTMPVLHLVLNRHKFDQAGEAMLQSINCTCNYFGEFGVCKHIVGVCQSMQKEFLEIEGKSILSKKENQLGSNLIGNIFDVEQKSKIRRLQEHFETYFAKSEVGSIYWFELFVHEVKKLNPKSNPLVKGGQTQSIWGDFQESESSYASMRNGSSVIARNEAIRQNTPSAFRPKLPLGDPACTNLSLPPLNRGIALDATRQFGSLDSKNHGDTVVAATSDLNSSQQYYGFLTELQHDFKAKLRDYDMEKKVYYLMTVSLQIGGRFWWEFWQDLIPDFTERQQLRLWSEVYRWKMSKITTEYNDLIEGILVAKTDPEKKQILEKLQDDYPNNLNLWLDFVLTSRYEQFLVDNLDKFDPDLLIDVAYILPEQRETIEIKIMNQVKVWSDFTKSGEYLDIINTMTKWAKLGRSDYFWETIKYIQIQHKKKPKLMKVLKQLEEN